MRRRTRSIAGTFALVALAVAFGETLLAATCAPGMDMASMDMAAMDVRAMAPEDAAAGDLALGTVHGHEDPDADDERDCPFGPASPVQGCAGVASLPTHPDNRVALPDEPTTSVFTEHAQQELLLQTALFHPPRA